MKKKTVYDFEMDGRISKDVLIDTDPGCEGSVETINEIGREEAMKILDCNLPMVSALQMLHCDIGELAKGIKADMIDLYEKIDLQG